MVKFISLKKNKEFIKILKKKRINNKYFTMYFNKNIDTEKENMNKFINISFVMKKKIGNAIVRNKIKRKLKSAVQKILNKDHLINLNYTYVIFGKNNVYKEKFTHILNETNESFKKIKQMDSYS